MLWRSSIKPAIYMDRHFQPTLRSVSAVFLTADNVQSRDTQVINVGKPRCTLPRQILPGLIHRIALETTQHLKFPTSAFSGGAIYRR